jgi:SAM-dependent methyltransferase
MPFPDRDAARDAQTAVCQACGAIGLLPLHEVRNIPVSSCVLVTTRQAAAEFPVGDMLLVLCEACGFIQNQWFDPALVDYSQAYEESQAHSPRFMEFATALVDRLIVDHGIRAKRALDVGCGKGSFLELLVERGDNEGIGIDPAIAPERIDPEVANCLELIRGYFDETSMLTGDLIACRHTLEHIPTVERFARLLAGAVRRTDDALLYVEVPDSLRILDEGAFWDIYYEHCSYFTPGSLGRLLSSVGLTPTGLELGFLDQYILGFARAAGTPVAVGDLQRIIAAAGRFTDTVEATIAAWDAKLLGWAAEGKTVVVWGASSKAVSFLTTLPAAASVEAAIDINPYKQNQYLAGTTVQVLGPASLPDLAPDVVVVMNPIYLDEIRAAIVAMGLSPHLDAL